MKPTWRRLTWLTLILSALVLSLAACGGDDEDDAAATTETAATTADKTATTVVIGTKNFTEEFILGELYSQALEAKGYTVELKKNIGSTEIIDKSLTSGRINFYPEYTGTALTVVHGSEDLRGQRRVDLRRGEGSVRGTRPDPARDDALLGLRRARDAERGRRGRPDQTRSAT